MSPQKVVQVEDYEPFIGPKTIDRIRKKAKTLQYLHVANVNINGVKPTKYNKIKWQRNSRHGSPQYTPRDGE
jgi:hypothetical protein